MRPASRPRSPAQRPRCWPRAPVPGVSSPRPTLYSLVPTPVTRVTSSLVFSVNYFCRFRTGGTTWPRGPTIRSTSSTLNDLRRTALSGHRGGGGGRFGSPLCRARAEGVGGIVRAVRGNGDGEPRLAGAHATTASSNVAAGNTPSSVPSRRTSTLPTCCRQFPEDLPPTAPSTALATAARPGGGSRPRLRGGARKGRTVGHENPGVIYGPGGQPADRNTEIFEIRRISDLEILGSHEL